MEGAIKLSPLSPLNAALASFIVLVLVIDVALVVVATFCDREERIPTALRDYASENLLTVIGIVCLSLISLVGAVNLADVNQLVELALICLIGTFVIWQNWPLFEAVYRVVRKAG